MAPTPKLTSIRNTTMVLTSAFGSSVVGLLSMLDAGELKTVLLLLVPPASIFGTLLVDEVVIFVENLRQERRHMKAMVQLGSTAAKVINNPNSNEADVQAANDALSSANQALLKKRTDDLNRALLGDQAVVRSRSNNKNVRGE